MAKQFLIILDWYEYNLTFINHNYKQSNHLKGFKNHNGNYDFIQIENIGA